jgi:uncharacterized protein (TIGR02598 family)
MRTQILTHRLSRAGFSLVEVALAVAIAALGIITCLGLLPEGMEMSRKTGQLAINSNIIDQIIRDLENAEWSVTSVPGGNIGGAGGSGNVRIYDYQGTPLIDGDAQSAASYVAQINSGQPLFLPGATGGTQQKYLRRLVVKVASSQDPGFDFSNNNLPYVTFSHILSKTR